MRTSLRCVGFSLLFLMANRAVGADKPAEIGPEAVRKSVEKALPFLEKEGLAWLENRKCIACHHGAYLIWSHREAARHGIAVDAKKLDAWTQHVSTLFLKDKPTHLEKKNGSVEATSILLARNGYVKEPLDEAASTALAVLAKSQQAVGSWKFEGQAQKRPDAEGMEATTLWALAVLGSADNTDEVGRKSRESALAWLEKSPVGTDNEAIAVRLVLAVQQGDKPAVQARVDELVKRQNADGGWSWSKDYPSDSYATGQSLYALGLAGRTGSDPDVQKGWQYLLSTQKPDGSWPGVSKKPGVKENPIILYWGSAWATIGLARTLP
jgi:hypothetical protein